MRILHLTPFYAPAWAYGGIPRAVNALVHAQSTIPGVEVAVVTTDVCDSHTRAGERQDGVHVFRNLSNTLAYRYMLLLPVGLRRFLREQLASFDVVHLHACRHLLNEIFMRARHHPPFVLSPHGTLPRIERRFLLKRTWDRVFGDAVLREASALLAVSESEARQFVGVDPNRIRRLPNIVEDPSADGADMRADPETAKALEAPYLLYLGKLTPRKRVDLLIRAYAALGREDLRLVIAGNDMGSGRALRELARRLAVESRVRFLGLQSGRDRAAVLSGARLLVYPGEHEVFGLVPFEGLHAGIVPVVSDDSGCGELVREGACGYCFRCGDAEDLSRVIADALGDDAGRDERLRRGRAFLEHFRPEPVARRSIEIYQEVIGTPV